MKDLRCGHPLHVERFAEPEWFDGVLGTWTGSREMVVYCGGCADADARLSGGVPESKATDQRLADLERKYLDLVTAVDLAAGKL